MEIFELSILMQDFFGFQKYFEVFLDRDFERKVEKVSIIVLIFGKI